MVYTQQDGFFFVLLSRFIFYVYPVSMLLYLSCIPVFSVNLVVLQDCAPNRHPPARFPSCPAGVVGRHVPASCLSPVGFPTLPGPVPCCGSSCNSVFDPHVTNSAHFPAPGELFPSLSLPHTECCRICERLDLRKRFYWSPSMAFRLIVPQN